MDCLFGETSNHFYSPLNHKLIYLLLILRKKERSTVHMYSKCKNSDIFHITGSSNGPQFKDKSISNIKIKVKTSKSRFI